MKERKQNLTYLSPRVTVVTFKIEQGFLGTLTAEPVNEVNGTEDVTANENGNLNDGFFPRNI